MYYTDRAKIKVMLVHGNFRKASPLGAHPFPPHKIISRQGFLFLSKFPETSDGPLRVQASSRGVSKFKG